MNHAGEHLVDRREPAKRETGSITVAAGFRGGRKRNPGAAGFTVRPTSKRGGERSTCPSPIAIVGRHGPVCTCREKGGRKVKVSGRETLTMFPRLPRLSRLPDQLAEAPLEFYPSPIVARSSPGYFTIRARDRSLKTRRQDCPLLDIYP